MPAINRLGRVVGLINHLPRALRPSLLSLLFASQVRFAGTARIRVVQLQRHRALLHLRNKSRVRNHIGGVHAAAMALLAESATGFLAAMNLPDDRLLLIKTLRVDYLRRAQGDLQAQAELSPEQMAQIAREARGELRVPVSITDASGQEPIECEMLWAWRPRES